MLPPITGDTLKVYAALRKSALLDKFASEASPAEVQAALDYKTEVDVETFELAKQAGLQGMLQAGKAILPTAAGIGSLAKTVGANPIARGAGYAAGAAVPAVMAGNMIADNAAEEFRNKALQAGGGLALMGGTMYGLHNALNKQGAAMSMLPTSVTKTLEVSKPPKAPKIKSVKASPANSLASDLSNKTSKLAEAMDKLAAVGYLDEVLMQTINDPNTSESLRKEATESYKLNREFGVDILQQLIA